MININNRREIMLNIFKWFFILFLPLVLFIYFRDEGLFSISLFVASVIFIVKVISYKFLNIYLSPDKISVKEFSISAFIANSPNKYIIVHPSSISNFHISERKKEVIFHILSSHKALAIKFSINYFEREKKIKLKMMLSQYIHQEK